ETRVSEASRNAPIEPSPLTMLHKDFAARQRGEWAHRRPTASRLVNQGEAHAAVNETSPMRARGQCDRICARRLADLDRGARRLPAARQQGRHHVQQRVEPPELSGTDRAIDRSGGDCHIGTAMSRSTALRDYYYPDEVGTG